MKDAKRPTVRLPTPEEDAAIVAAAKADPDAQPLTGEQLRAMVPMRAHPSVRAIAEAIHVSGCRDSGGDQGLDKGGPWRHT